MIRLLALFLIPFALMFTPARPSATTLYVSPRGSDSRSCSRAAPCRTLARADAHAGAGATVHVAAGHYGATTLNASGTATARIRWVSDTRWGSKISATSASSLTVVAVQGAYVDFQGFDVTGSGGDGTVGIDVAGSQSRAIGNRVHNIAVPCGWYGGAGIDLSGSHIGRDQEAIGNLVTDVGSGPRNGSCRAVHGIYASVPGVKIINNVVARAVGDGITSWHSATNLTIANNTSTQNSGFGVLLGGNVPPFNRGSYVVNNIAAFNHLGGIVECCTASPPQGAHYLNNLTYANSNGPNGPQFDGTPAASFRTVHRNPRFLNSSADNYRLRVGSPAIDSGTSTAAPRTDFDGNTRPNGARFNRGPFSQWRHRGSRFRRR